MNAAKILNSAVPVAPFRFSTHLVEGKYCRILWLYARKRLVDAAYIVVNSLDILILPQQEIFHKSVERKNITTL